MTAHPAPDNRPPVIEFRAPGDLIPYARNARTHSEAQVAQIAGSIREFGFTNPVLIDDENGIIAGHGRVMAALKLRLEQVPCIRLSTLTPTQRRAYIIADNKLALNAGWDEDMLAVELEELKALDFDLALTGFGEDELAELLNISEADLAAPVPSLAERFGAVPFSVLDARQGWWRDRKSEWLACGIRSELGRPEDLTMPSKTARAESTRKIAAAGNTTSTFDPVLCELVYRWFSPLGGTVLDPFAGGSVRGIVAARLGRPYVGIELRAEQVRENERQAVDILTDEDEACEWRVGDSATEPLDDIDADLVFTCPPYADLEVYSDDPRDISTMEYGRFLAVYRAIIARACARLRPDRFAVVVVGEVRDPAGNYRGFVPDTIAAFVDAGLALYNEAILVTPAGSLPIRAAGAFVKARKLGKTHQNVLVFVKGDGARAARACGAVEVAQATPEDDT